MRSIAAGIAILLGVAGPACDGGGGGGGSAGVIAPFVEAKRKLAKVAVDRLAREDAVLWSVSSRQECPESLLAVVRFAGRAERDTLDPWGTPYQLRCGAAQLPPGVRGFAVLSLGPDQQEGTADDIRSWQPL